MIEIAMKAMRRLIQDQLLDGMSIQLKTLGRKNTKQKKFLSKFQRNYKGFNSLSNYDKLLFFTVQIKKCHNVFEIVSVDT